MNGILVVDKPYGCTSHDVVARVRRLARQRDIGHAGTLDPMATGVLLLCLGAATRVSEMLMDGLKWYLARISFGVSTNTDDALGTVTASMPARFGQAALLEALRAQVGLLAQVPPAFAAIKQHGVPAYRRARAGKPVALQPRPVEVHAITLLSFSAQTGVEAVPGLTADVLVACGKGTYIRSLARDVGAALGCGAHLSGLRRLGSGCFTTDSAHPLADLEAAVTAGGPPALAALLQPLDAALSAWPAAVLGNAAAEPAWHGNSLILSGVAGLDRLRLYTLQGDLLGLASVSVVEGEARVQPRRVFASGDTR